MSQALIAGACVLAGVGALLACSLVTSPGALGRADALARRTRLAARDVLARLPQTRERLMGSSSGRGLLGGDRRRREVVRGRVLDELPELMDVVALGLSCGVSFDAALMLYCQRYDGWLSGRLQDAMRSWRLGLRTRKEALDEVAREADVGALRTFVSTVTESLAFGAPLAQTLVEQAENVRELRRAQQQEKVEKSPVKMLVPTATLILPAMLLAILGPMLAALAGM